MVLPGQLDSASVPVRAAGRQARTRVLLVAAMGVIVLLGVVVRVRHLPHPMRYDESYNYLHFVSQGPRHIITHYVPNNHILHTLCVWAVSRIAGHSPSALRIPALIAGILVIPATGWLAWVLSRRKLVVLLSGLGACCSSALIEYSVNARGYSMFTLFAVLAAICLLRSMERPDRRRGWIWWGVCGAAGMYTVPIMALPLLGMAMVVAGSAIASRDTAGRAAILRGLATGTGVGVLLSVLAYLPVGLAGGLAAFTNSRELAYEHLGPQIPSSWEMAYATFSFWTRHVPIFLVIATILGILAYVAQCIRKKDINGWMLLGIVVVPLLAALAASAPMPARTWLFAMPFLFVMAAQGLAGFETHEPNRARMLCFRGVQIAGALALIVSLGNVWRSVYLCSEPRGLVLVEPALKECDKFGATRCALISPYSPAAAYYKVRCDLPTPIQASSPEAERVYILTSLDRSLGDLWSPGVSGFELFSPPRMVWERPGGALYVAERVERNALR